MAQETKGDVYIAKAAPPPKIRASRADTIESIQAGWLRLSRSWQAKAIVSLFSSESSIDHRYTKRHDTQDQGTHHV